jgi:putative tricarboxylic transport membrane protein
VRRVYQTASLIFIAVGIYVALEARDMAFYTVIGPGPGFFPLVLGIVFVGLSIAWLGQVSLQSEEPMEKEFIPKGVGVVRIISILAALMFFSLLVDVIGFQLVMLFFLLFLLNVLGRQNLILKLVVSAAGSFGLYYVFKSWLGVSLPEASIEVIRNLGL